MSLSTPHISLSTVSLSSYPSVRFVCVVGGAGGCWWRANVWRGGGGEIDSWPKCWRHAVEQLAVREVPPSPSWTETIPACPEWSCVRELLHSIRTCECECAYACACLLVCVWAHALASSYLCMCMGALAYVCVCACMCQCVSVFVSVRVCGLTVLPFFFNRSPGIRHPTSCLLNVTYFTVDHVSG